MATQAADYVRDEDLAFYERELASFMPDRVFDAHVHLWHPDHYDNPYDGVAKTVGSGEFRAMLDHLHPGRPVEALFIPYPYPNADGSSDIDNHSERANAWIARHTAAEPRCRGLFNVQPTHDPQWVRQEVRRLGLHGLKCYHTWSANKPTWQADIHDYLPEPLVKVAHEEGWCITLHIVKTRAVADPSNIHWIRRYCETYPNMKLILAHSARGHNPAHNLEGLMQLTGLDNLYFDTSSVCEPTSHEAIIRYMGHEKLLYGSDFQGYRGRSLGAADAFVWIYEDTPVWGGKHATIKPVCARLEGNRSLKWACWSARLTDSQVEDIFWNNAAKLFGVE